MSTYTLYNDGTYNVISTFFSNFLEKRGIICTEVASSDFVIFVGNHESNKYTTVKISNPSAITISINSNNKDTLLLLDTILHNRFNLAMDINGSNFTVFDPLGNVWYEGNDLDKSFSVLVERMEKYTTFKRIGTENLSIKDLESFVKEHRIITFKNEQVEFIEQYVKKVSEVFYSFMNVGESTKRYLGNSSFRCIRGGFPSFRTGKHSEFIAVSPRNSDKRCIGIEDMVIIYPNSTLFDRNISRIGYFTLDGSDRKPSVDTPVQLMLYERFKWINYIIHTHAYVKGAKYTENVYPCGCINEYSEIAKKIPQLEKNDKGFSLNLLGHGSLSLAKVPEYFNSIEFVSRFFLEKQTKI